MQLGFHLVVVVSKLVHRKDTTIFTRRNNTQNDTKTQNTQSRKQNTQNKTTNIKRVIRTKQKAKDSVKVQPDSQNWNTPTSLNIRTPNF